eukprot:TRINITY_DN91009_c0_g1_i1.p1 TRINITY_DN91009_c0_g1~~TRINITY_DN91009_c0_g1_i1.p1  ORF type:complete len:691 (-),score=172.20 TRINITY_DN91009_c0_g1_i1:99-2171(-)
MAEGKCAAPGFVFPVGDETLGDGLRVIVYTIMLIYIFLGMNIVSAKFMEAIENITAKKLRKRDKKTGRVITVMRWNETVANVTLLALGSSAPEILMSCAEVTLNNFHSGQLGPSTIVGSAAFNLFVIVGVCVATIPSPETRQIKATGAYAITSGFSLLIYLWVFLTLQYISPNVIEIWEAIVTLMFLPALVLVSWLDDHGHLAFLANKDEFQEDLMEEEELEELSDTESIGEEGHQRRQEQDLDPAHVVMDYEGQPLVNSQGVLTFAEDMMTVPGGPEEKPIYVRVFRRNGSQGLVSCKYRTEKLTAMPGIDYEEQEGELAFEDGETEAEIVITVLTKKSWVASDSFQLILEEPDGGVIFNPNHDGAEECAFLTIYIDNVTDFQRGCGKKTLALCDLAMNCDELLLGHRSWRTEIKYVLTDINGSDRKEARLLDWTLYVVSLPWNLLFALIVPPIQYCGGWISFFVCIVYISGVSVIILDLAAMWSCLLDLRQCLVAIMLLALGTSLPSFSVSQQGAVIDEFADASIVNVTSSIAVNMLLGVALPWTIASIYWQIAGATDDWKKKYPEFKKDYPDGAFIVEASDIAFLFAVFAVMAAVVLMLIKVRRSKFGGELGGPMKPKVASAAFMIVVWLLFIAMAFWKMVFDMADITASAGSLFSFENVVFIIGIMVNLTYVAVSLNDLKDRVGTQ